MNHQETLTILAELLSGEIDDAAAAPAWEHVAGCRECREVLPAVFQVRAAIAARGPEVFSSHPSSEDIVQFALSDNELSIPGMARIGSHVRACPACERAVEITRGADAATRTRRPLERQLWDPGLALERVPRVALAFVPALAIMVVLLAFPAYRGIVAYPELRRTHATATQDLARLHTEKRELRGELTRRAARLDARAWAGPTRILFLPATTRGSAGAPDVARGADQIYQPIVVQHRPFAGNSPTGTIEVRLLRQSGETVWSEQRPVASLWDPAHSSLVLLVPAGVLEPGGYQLEILRGGEPSYASAFTVSQRMPAERNR